MWNLYDKYCKTKRERKEKELTRRNTAPDYSFRMNHKNFYKQKQKFYSKKFLPVLRRKTKVSKNVSK